MRRWCVGVVRYRGPEPGEGLGERGIVVRRVRSLVVDKRGMARRGERCWEGEGNGLKDCNFSVGPRVLCWAFGSEGLIEACLDKVLDSYNKHRRRVLETHLNTNVARSVRAASFATYLSLRVSFTSFCPCPHLLYTITCIAPRSAPTLRRLPRQDASRLYRCSKPNEQTRQAFAGH